jgi:hypothetical protein
MLIMGRQGCPANATHFARRVAMYTDGNSHSLGGFSRQSPARRYPLVHLLRDCDGVSLQQLVNAVGFGSHVNLRWLTTSGRTMLLRMNVPAHS